uniref:Reverse transcriptase domain-containing protein n=1 Tax=Arundo donax TaxID=35708 RepID=A0A0A9CAR7_ARUDO
MTGPNKSPGPDGFTAGFFQRHWELLGPCVTRAVLNFLNGGVLPVDINKTILVLIPKVKSPQELKQFRPISLCNVIYKLCSKVIANRLKVFLDEIISEEQSAFVPSRLITDDVLVAYECTHYLKRKKGKFGACAVKLDMAKAYDRVEWCYLQGILEKMGFAEQSVSLIMQCVTSVSFSVRVNGQLTAPFIPSRGIRQGDPISPYLFLLCAEGLSSLLKYVGPVHLSRGVRVSTYSPWISHLLFADDCLVFSEASRRGADRLKEILDMYSKGSG